LSDVAEGEVCFSRRKARGGNSNESKIATVKNLAETAVLLPPKDRVYLAEQLLASLDASEVEQQWRSEGKRRRDEVRSGHIKPIPAEKVYRRIDRLLGR
jgi:putative addiction module component (TIGR02574 family)